MQGNEQTPAIKEMRKRLFILSAVLFCSINFLSAQVTFQKTFGGIDYDRGGSVNQTADGGYIIIGSTNNLGAGGGVGTYLIKTNNLGDSVWTKILVGITGTDAQQTSDEGYIIAGFTGSFGAGDYDIFLTRTDTNGDVLWTKTYGGINNDQGYSVQQTTDGGYIVTGYNNSFASGNQDICLIKTDLNGDTLWTKTFSGADSGSGQCVRQTTDGGYIITGYISVGVTSTHVYLIKTDTIGNILWAKTYGGAGGDLGESVKQTMDGGYIITGRATSFSGGDWDVYLIKTDANGDTLWSKTFSGINTLDWGYSVGQTNDGGYIISFLAYSFGPDSTKIYLIKTDVNGNGLWTKAFGGIDNEWGAEVQQTADGGYIIIGNTESFGVGLNDIYLIKTDANGNSGCNQWNVSTIVSNPATQVTSPALIVSSGVTITTPAIVTGSGTFVTALCAGVGISETEAANLFLIFPNPSADNFIISFERTIVKGKIEILNILGEKVFSDNIFYESKMKINLKNISQGIYFVKVSDGEKYYCKKIIIKQD